MANQPIPPPGMDPLLPDHLTPDQRLVVWVDLMDTSEAFLLAGRRCDVGPEGDVREAYRRWRAGQTEDHARAPRRSAENPCRRGVRHGCQGNPGDAPAC